MKNISLGLGGRALKAALRTVARAYARLVALPISYTLTSRAGVSVNTTAIAFGLSIAASIAGLLVAGRSRTADDAPARIA